MGIVCRSESGQAEAVLGILALYEADKMELVGSEVLQFKIARTPNITRRDYAWEVLSSVRTFVQLTPEIEARAHELCRQGIKALDALHLAAAEAASADYLCTCDDQFYGRAQTITDVEVEVVNPLELMGELGK